MPGHKVDEETLLGSVRENMSFSPSALERWLQLSIVQITGCFFLKYLLGRKEERECFSLLITCRKFEHSTQSKPIFRKAARFSVQDKGRSEDKTIGALSSILMMIPLMKKKVGD